MLSQVVFTLSSRRTWLVADLPLRPSPCLELLHRSYARFSSHRRILASSKTDKMLHDQLKHTQSEVILESLRKLDICKRFKCATPPSETKALSVALRKCGLEKHTAEFHYPENLLPVAQKVQLLVSEAVSTSDMKTLLRKRAFFSTTVEKFAAVFNLLKRLFLTGENAAKVLACNAGLLLQSIENLEMKFKHFEEFGVDEESRMKIGVADIGVLKIKEESIHKRLAFLQDIGLSVQSRNRILRKFPRFLTLSIEASAQHIDFLQSRGMDRAIVLKLVCVHPEILGMSVNKNLAIKFDLLRELGFTPDGCCKAIRWMAKCSCKFVVARCDFLQTQGFSRDDVFSMIRKFPPIFSKSEKDIKRRINYLVNVADRNLEEIVKFPPCLGYSLEQRIIPRFNILLEMDILKKYSMASILAVNMEDFKKRFIIPNEQLIEDAKIIS